MTAAPRGLSSKPILLIESQHSRGRTPPSFSNTEQQTLALGKIFLDEMVEGEGARAARQ
jgi:hypothetical protein